MVACEGSYGPIGRSIGDGHDTSAPTSDNFVRQNTLISRFFSCVSTSYVLLVGKGHGGPHRPPDCVQKGPPNPAPPLSPLHRKWWIINGRPLVAGCVRFR